MIFGLIHLDKHIGDNYTGGFKTNVFHLWRYNLQVLQAVKMVFLISKVIDISFVIILSNSLRLYSPNWWKYNYLLTINVPDNKWASYLLLGMVLQVVQ